MDPTTILALIAIINTAATMIEQHANGQQHSPDDLATLQAQTKALSDQIDAMRTDKPNGTA